MDKFNEELELLIDLIEGCLQEEGYKTMKYSNSDNLGTTSYENLAIRDTSGNEYALSIDVSVVFNKLTNRWEKTNYLK